MVDWESKNQDRGWRMESGRLRKEDGGWRIEDGMIA
jgi:hypothetical protein